MQNVNPCLLAARARGGVLTKQLNQAVRRSFARFPADFVFKLSQDEWRYLKSQIVTSNAGLGGRGTRPWAVRSQIASAILAAELTELEKRVTAHDSELREIIAILRGLLHTEPKPRRKIAYSS